MKPKTKAFLDKVASNEKISATQAYIETHATTNRASARASASKILAKPSAQIYLDSHRLKARNKIVELVDSDRPQVALKASESILDRDFGKPLQRATISQEVVQINIDLTTPPQ
jgi:hypothetical protein